MDNKTLWELSKADMLPNDHVQYLYRLRDEYGFIPSVAYDIGSCALHWSKPARTVWPTTNFFLFEAMEQVEEIYLANNFLNYNLGVLSDSDNKELVFYQNNDFPGGNSYYRENPAFCAAASVYFSDDHAYKRIAMTLDTIVKTRNFPYPELLKLDVQGCEIDILRGATECLKTVKHLIVELQHVEYNQGALKADVSVPYIESLGFKLEKPLFSRLTFDGDYHFIKI